MDHLSTMKRKNVVLVYDLLLEMLDANTPSGSHSQAPPSPSSDPYTDQQHQYPPPASPSHLQQASDHTGAPPCGPPEDLSLDRHLQPLSLQSLPTFQSLAVVHMDANG